MRIRARARAATVVMGLVASGLIVSGGAAEAATPSCWTQVIGVTSNGRILNRIVHGTRMTEQKVSTTAVGVPAESIVAFFGRKFTGGVTYRYHVYSPGRRAAEVDVTDRDSSSNLTTKVVGHFGRASNARHLANGAKYFTYGVDGSGNLKRWTRLDDGSGQQYLGAAKTVARNMGNLRTLSYQSSYKASGGNRDVLFGTTRAGALKQIQVPWNAPGKPKITMLRATGFASTTGLSLSQCGLSGSHASIIAIDRTHNRARWYTLRNSFTTPQPSSLVNRGLVARGANWNLHATT